MPKPDERTKRQAGKLTRLEKMKTDKITPTLPPVTVPHLVNWLMEVGLSKAAGMGAGPIGWDDIMHWRVATGITLEPWVARMFRRLSGVYVAEGRTAEPESTPAPYRLEVQAREVEIEEAMLRTVLG